MTGEIERIVTDEQRRLPIPGVAIGILSGNDETTAAFGVTSVEDPLPVTPDTLFQIGSITKTFLATLVMHLVEHGALDLDVPVRRWVPDLRLQDGDAAARVTLRHCLTHTAGWFGDHFIDTGWDDDALARYVATLGDLPQQVPLGTTWAYNNAAFALVGRVVEVVADRPIEHAMRELLFTPLGLERTFFFPGEVITYRHVVGHNVFDGEARVVRPWALPRASDCIGGIVSTVRDLLAYARFHMGDGTTAGGQRYLSRATLDLMQAPQVPAALGAHRGIAWDIQDVAGVRTIGHGGATFGQQALFWFAPARRYALAMLTNTSQAAQIQDRMTRWAWREGLGVTKEPPAPRAFTADEAQRVAGTYRTPANELRVVPGEGELILHQQPNEEYGFRKLQANPPPVPKPVELSFSADDRLLLLEGPLKGSQIEILSREWVRFGSRIYRRVEP